MSRTIDILRSPPVPVRFAGFEATTTTLQRCGWQLAVQEERDYYRGHSPIRYTLALKAPDGLELYGVSDFVDCSWHLIHRELQYGRIAWDELVSKGFYIKKFSPSIMIQRIIMPADRGRKLFLAIDAEPSFETLQMGQFHIEEISVFKPMMQAKEEIIVKPESIPDLMNRILELQEPKQKEIRERIINEGYIPRDRKIEAQIISLR